MELTREQIKEGNDSIADFLGWFKEDGHEGSWFINSEFAKYVVYSIHNNYPHQDLPFHRDWNYLMKVVDKLGVLIYGEDWKKHYSYSELFSKIWQKWIRLRFETKDDSFNLMNDIESIWNAVVTSINNLKL